MINAKKFLIVLMIISAFFMSSCTKSTDTEIDKTKDNEPEKAVSETVSKEPEENSQDKASTDEQKAVEIVNSYVKAAKALNFEQMDKYISDSRTLPILESYRAAYSGYSISDSRIQELCRARLSTYDITPVSAVKSGNSIIVSANISMVNMESLQNKWMETLCNKYPEYTELSQDEMTPKVVDILIQTMIDVLNDADSTIDLKKDLTLIPKGDSWIINAKNEDLFPSK